MTEVLAEREIWFEGKPQIIRIYHKTTPAGSGLSAYIVQDDKEIDIPEQGQEDAIVGVAMTIAGFEDSDEILHELTVKIGEGPTQRVRVVRHHISSESLLRVYIIHDDEIEQVSTPWQSEYLAEVAMIVAGFKEEPV